MSAHGITMQGFALLHLKSVAISGTGEGIRALTADRHGCLQHFSFKTLAGLSIT